MNKYLSIATLLVATNVYAAGSCVICPFGYECEGGTAAPTKTVTPSTDPIGSIVYMSNTNSAHYDDDFYAEMGSDEKNALDSVPDSATDSECPPGYLYADGRTLNIKDYPALFKKIGQAYGFNSSKQYASFKLPDLRGMFIRGIGGNSAALGVFQDSENKEHTHDTDMSYHGGNRQGGGTGSTTPMITAPSGGIESRPMNYAMYACIKY